jgi:hypothetical protein
MSQNLSRSFNITYLVITSFVGLFLAAMLTVYPPRAHENFPWRKPLIGSIFGLICIFGILAVFFPMWCSRIFDLRKKPSRPYLGKFASHGASLTLQGHHPDCGNFDAHVFRIGEKTFCAACTGLLLGGLLALVGTFLYFFCNWSFGHSSSSIVWIGVLGVGFGLFQFRFRSFVRLFLNIFFVLGTFFILIGVDELVNSVNVDLFLVALTLFWLFTRISLSQWDHERICYACKVVACEFRNRKKESELLSAGVTVEGSGNHQYPNDNYQECPQIIPQFNLK